MTQQDDGHSFASNAIGFFVWAVIFLGYFGAALVIGSLAGWIATTEVIRMAF